MPEKGFWFLRVAYQNGEGVEGGEREREFHRVVRYVLALSRLDFTR